MSEHLLSVEELEEITRRDTRFAAALRKSSIEADLRDNDTIKAIITAITNDADQAMEELSEISPLDAPAIAVLLVRIKTFTYIRRTLNAAINHGRVAAQHLQTEYEMADQSRSDE